MDASGRSISFRVAWPMGLACFGVTLVAGVVVSLLAPVPFWAILLLAVLTATGTGLAIALWLRPTRRAVRDFQEALNRAAQGDFSTRLDVGDEGLWSGLAFRWNQAATSIQGLLQMVRDETERTTIAFDNITDGIILTNGAGVVTLINPSATRLFGQRRLPAVGRPIIEVVQDHELWDLVQGTLATGEAVGQQVEVGLERRLLRMTVRRLGSGPDTAALVVFQDLTEVRRLEGIRREFVANVSHELRTPLASIKVMVETLEGGALGDPEAAPEFLRKINSEVDRMTALVRELLDLSRIETGQVELRHEAVDVAHLVADGLERLEDQARQKGVTLAGEVPPGLPPIEGDWSRLRQVLVNLLHNGIKFTPSGGSVTVTAGADRDAGEVTLVVRDTGVGVPSDDLPHLFERFYKADKARSSEGTGLGLAISKHIVQAHGGRITVESREGRGATFTVTLPAWEDGQAPPAEPSRPAGASLGVR